MRRAKTLNSGCTLFCFRLLDVRWIYDNNRLDPRYVSSTSIQWDKISKVAADLQNGKQRKLTIGLLNFNLSEVESWQQARPDSEISVVTLEHAESSVTWEKLYPEWIDEEEEDEIPSCPSLPDPKINPGLYYNYALVIISIRISCKLATIFLVGQYSIGYYYKQFS
jgi:xylan alpha-glucuronosyltransferase